MKVAVKVKINQFNQVKILSSHSTLQVYTYSALFFSVLFKMSENKKHKINIARYTKENHDLIYRSVNGI